MPSSLAVFGGANHSDGIGAISSSATQTVAPIAAQAHTPAELNFIGPSWRLPRGGVNKPVLAVRVKAEMKPTGRERYYPVGRQAGEVCSGANDGRE